MISGVFFLQLGGIDDIELDAKIKDVRRTTLNLFLQRFRRVQPPQRRRHRRRRRRCRRRRRFGRLGR